MGCESVNLRRIEGFHLRGGQPYGLKKKRRHSSPVQPVLADWLSSRVLIPAPKRPVLSDPHYPESSSASLPQVLDLQMGPVASSKD